MALLSLVTSFIRQTPGFGFPNTLCACSGVYTHRIHKENLCSFSNLEAQQETLSDPVLVRIPLLGKEGVEEHPNIYKCI